MISSRLNFLRWSLLGLLLGGLTASAQVQIPVPANLARSVSGQFVVHGGVKPSTRMAITARAGERKLLDLEPSFVAVSCERIKQALVDEIGPAGLWRGKIFIALQPARSAEDEIVFICERFRDSWSYRLDVPNPVQPERFVRGIVQALLLEQSNRNARERAAELPLWLSEGLAQQILIARGSQVLLARPGAQGNGLSLQPAVIDFRRTSASSQAWAALGGRSPLTLEELSWPKENQLAGPDAEIYRLSARLLVAELLRLPEGRASFTKMLEQLPSCLNWQTALLRAFHPQFERQLDVERWWTLQTVHFTGRKANDSWSAPESWAKLDEILHVAAELRQEKTELPKLGLVPLATVIRDWPFARQAEALRNKTTELHLARQRLAPEFLALAEGYQKLLEQYLAQRARAGLNSNSTKANTPTAQKIMRETLQQLDSLEQARAQARPAPATDTAQVEATSPAQP